MGSSPVPVGVTVSWDGPGTWPMARGLAVTLSSRCVPQLQNLVPLQPCPVGAPWGSTTAGGLSGSAGADRSVTPFLLRTGTSPSLSRRSIRTVIFSCRYFPQANFSVTFHPFLSVSGCYFLPWRCLPSQIPAAPPRSQPRGWHRVWGRRTGRAGCAGLLRRDFGNPSQHPRGDAALASGGRSWKSPGSARERVWGLLRQLRGRGGGLGGKWGAEGTPGLLGFLRPPEPTAAVLAGTVGFASSQRRQQEGGGCSDEP